MFALFDVLSREGVVHEDDVRDGLCGGSKENVLRLDISVYKLSNVQNLNYVEQL